MQGAIATSEAASATSQRPSPIRRRPGCRLGRPQPASPVLPISPYSAVLRRRTCVLRSDGRLDHPTARDSRADVPAVVPPRPGRQSIRERVSSRSGPPAAVDVAVYDVENYRIEDRVDGFPQSGRPGDVALRIKAPHSRPDPHLPGHHPPRTGEGLRRALRPSRHRAASSRSNSDHDAGH